MVPPLCVSSVCLRLLHQKSLANTTYRKTLSCLKHLSAYEQILILTDEAKKKKSSHTVLELTLVEVSNHYVQKLEIWTVSQVLELKHCLFMFNVRFGIQDDGVSCLLFF